MKSGKLITKNIPKSSIGQAIDGLRMFYDAYKHNVSVQEIEKTKRIAIQAAEKVQLESIRQQASIVKQALELHFKERSNNFTHLFDALDVALEKDEPEAIASILGVIVKISEDSPLSKAQQAIDDFNRPEIKKIEI